MIQLTPQLTPEHQHVPEYRDHSPPPPYTAHDNNTVAPPQYNTITQIDANGTRPTTILANDKRPANNAGE